MVKIAPIIRRSAVNTRVDKIQKIKISENSGLPYEMPLDSFQKESELINMLHPATPMYNAEKQIENLMNKNFHK